MTALQQKVETFLATDYTTSVTTKEQAEKAINFLKELHGEIAGSIENDLADLAVKFQINVYLGDYGTGRSVALEDEDGGGWGEPIAAGEWVPSSARC